MYEFKHKKTHKQRTAADILDPDLRYLWEERVAICIIDGKVTPQRAEQIAWEQHARNLKNLQNSGKLTGLAAAPAAQC